MEMPKQASRPVKMKSQRSHRTKDRPVDISVVSPVYLGEKTVDRLVLEVSEAVSKITKEFEIILVEDGNPDGSWDRIAG